MLGLISEHAAESCQRDGLMWKIIGDGMRRLCVSEFRSAYPVSIGNIRVHDGIPGQPAREWQGLLGGLNGLPKHSVSCLTGRGPGERRLGGQATP
jgi:hypothetical protein